MGDVDPSTVDREGRRQRRPSLTPLSLFLILLILYIVIEVRIVILILLFALLFATILDGPVSRLEKRGIPRAGAILIVYVGIIAGSVGIGLLVVPPITNEALKFWDDAPVQIGDLAEEWRTSDNSFLSTTGYRVMTQLQFRIENPPPPTGSTAIGLVSGVGGLLFGLVATFVTGFYYLMEKQLFRNLILDLAANDNRDRVNRLWDEVESKVGDWLRGQLLLMLVIGVFAGIGYVIIGVRFWLLLALVAGITEAIPIIGPWIGGIPAVIMALVDSWEKALIVGAFLILLQFAENSILVPRIMRGTIGLSPLAVFIAVLVGGQFAGPLGALLALPTAAAIQVAILDILRVRNADRSLAYESGSAGPSNGPQWGAIVTRFLGGKSTDRASDESQERTAESQDPIKPNDD